MKGEAYSLGMVALVADRIPHGKVSTTVIIPVTFTKNKPEIYRLFFKKKDCWLVGCNGAELIELAFDAAGFLSSLSCKRACVMLKVKNNVQPIIGNDSLIMHDPVKRRSNDYIHRHKYVLNNTMVPT
jgi:hypothetical protein